MLYWIIFMIVTCYAHLISMARISENHWHQCLTYQTIVWVIRSTYQTVRNSLLVTATKWDKTCLITDWTTTGEQRQLRMIFTITAQSRSKGMITPSVVKTVWKQRYTPQNKKSGHHFTYLDNYIIQRWMNKQAGFNAEQIDKDKYPESKNRLKIKSKITS